MTGTAVYGTVRTVVWEDGGGNPASYPICVFTKNILSYVTKLFYFNAGRGYARLLARKKLHDIQL